MLQAQTMTVALPTSNSCVRITITDHHTEDDDPLLRENKKTLMGRLSNAAQGTQYTVYHVRTSWREGGGGEEEKEKGWF